MDGQVVAMTLDSFHAWGVVLSLDESGAIIPDPFVLLTPEQVKALRDPATRVALVQEIASWDALPADSPARQFAYVNTSLECCTVDSRGLEFAVSPEPLGAEIGDDGLIVGTVPDVYRYLDPLYYAWLRGRVTKAKGLHDSGKLDGDAWEATRSRFNRIHEFAVAKYGDAALTEAVSRLSQPSVASQYTAPSGITIRALWERYEAVEQANRQLLTAAERSAAWRASHPASPEVIRAWELIESRGYVEFKGWEEPGDRVVVLRDEGARTLLPRQLTSPRIPCYLVSELATLVRVGREAMVTEFRVRSVFGREARLVEPAGVQATV